MTAPEKLYLPTEKDFYQAVDRISKVHGGPAGVAKAITDYLHPSVAKSMSERRYLLRMQQLGEIIEPRDFSTEELQNPTKNASKAFFRGAIAGIFLFKEAYKGKIHLNSVFDTVPELPSDNEESAVHYQYILSNNIFSLSESGLVMMGESAKEIIVDWEMASMPEDVPNQIYFRRSLGLAAFAGYRALEAKIEEEETKSFNEFQSQMDDFNSDQFFGEFEKLLNSVDQEKNESTDTSE